LVKKRYNPILRSGCKKEAGHAWNSVPRNLQQLHIISFIQSVYHNHGEVLTGCGVIL